MQGILVAGLLFTYLMTAVVLFRWGNLRCCGEYPTRLLTFFAILFTSGLDVGLIMLPLTEFSSYQDVQSHPEYAFSNPLAIAFGFWGFAVWLFYFLPCFYFCVIEPRVHFFERPVIKCINNVLIVGICAFSSSLLLRNLPWYLPQLGDGKTIIPAFYLIVFISITFAVLSSTRIAFIKYLSLFSLLVFAGLVVLLP